MKEQQEIIQKICGILKHDAILNELCVCKLTAGDFSDLSAMQRKYILLGWLKSKEVLIGVYGEEEIVFSIKLLGSTYDESSLPAWQYHHDEMGYTVEECLAYYGRFLGLDNTLDNEV